MSATVSKAVTGSATAKNRHLFTIDVETTGDANEIVAIGYCVGDLLGNRLAKGRIGVVYDPTKMEKRCFDEFWSKNLDLLKVLQKDALPPKVAMQQFVDILDTQEKQGDVTILTDNPSFDVAYVDRYLNLYTTRQPLKYTATGKYRGVRDISELCMKLANERFEKWTYSQAKADKAIKAIDVKHDHYPENDAEFIWRKLLAMLNSIEDASGKPIV